MVISLSNALIMAITDLKKPIISKFEIYYLALNISKSKSYNGQIIRAQRKEFGFEKNSSLISKLVSAKFIFSDSNFTNHYRVSTESNGNCDEICCLVDPFCYISHLSAMYKYGLTNRIPEIVILTTPEAKLWKKMKEDLEKKYQKQFDEKIQHSHIKKAVFPKTVRKMKIKLIESKFIHPSIEIKDSYARISDIGHTFLDMISNPELCGGMSHVIEIWKESAKTYLDEIIETIDKSSKGIIKCRAGYILDEILNTKNDRVNNWKNFAQRGGSRVLDPNSPYKSKFSENWMISINV